MIVFMTDFGERDPYVGIMKGVLLGIKPETPIVDLTHAIPPGDIAEGAFVLLAGISYFPKAALFVIVVDPGVGSGRKILYVETKKHRFLAPDNGILEMVLEAEKPVRIFQVTNERYFRKPVSNTFHGRDIFAPVAAHLHAGLNPEELGPPLSSAELVHCPIDRPFKDKEGNWHGSVVYIDQFGNLVTNLWQSLLQLKGEENVELLFKGEMIKGLAKSYANHHKGPVALLNSFHAIEIALNQESAAKTLGARKGDEVIFRCQTSSS